MGFLSLTPFNFRNLSNKMIDLNYPEVFFCGENGQGKSNLLEAIYFSSYASSFRTHKDNDMIKEGEFNMSVRSLYSEENGNGHSTFMVLDKGKKKIEKDGKMIHDRKELINAMPCVLFNHDDMDFVIGDPERRRFFLDQSLSMYDAMYIDVLRRYKKILKNRNLCLKEQNYNLLDTYDIQLVMSGLEIQKKRKDAVFIFNQIFENLYEKVTGIEGINIKYVPSWKKMTDEIGGSDINIPSIDEVMNNLINKREAEKIMGTTLSGPQRDKFVFERRGSDFIPQASTGQRRLIALMLRNAQAVYYKKITNRKPVLLMDDVLLELDPEKRKKFTTLLPEYEQLFCTFLPGEPYENYKNENTKVYDIVNGDWK